MLICLALALGGIPTAGQEDVSSGATPEPTSGDRDGQMIMDLVGKAWATGDKADIDAIYYPDAVFVLDGEQLARGREQLMGQISDAIAYGNTYTQVGPVIEYREQVSGDLYIAHLTDVQGPTHRWGDPLVCFFRTHAGLVTHHVCMLASGY